MLEVDRIKELAKSRGMKFSSLASELGLNPNFLNDVAAGKCRLSEKRLEQIAEILETTTKYLHGETDEKNKPTPEIGNEPTFDNNDINLLVQFYKGFSDEQRKELVAEAFRIWQKEQNNNQ